MLTIKSVSLTTLFVLSLLGYTHTFAQTQYPNQASDPLKITRDVRYSTGVPQPKRGNGFYELSAGNIRINVKEHDTENVNLDMDIYEPLEGSSTLRPLIIFCFGGGFFAGERDHPEITGIVKEMALNGFVTASIDYRLGINVFDTEASRRSAYRGLQDSRAAVRFFRADANNGNKYRVDPNRIYIAGYSAGGIIALNNAYLDRDIERPASTRNASYRYRSDTAFQTFQMPDMGCLDCAGGNQGYSGKANGAISLSGAISVLSEVEGPEDVPVLMFHGAIDNVVFPEKGQPLGFLSFLPNFDLPIIYGSALIHERALNEGAPNRYYEYHERGHAIHFNPTNYEVYPDIASRMSEFLYGLAPKTNNQARMSPLTEGILLKAIQAYPNPVKDGILNIKANFVERGTAQVQLFDATGRAVYEQAYQGLVEPGNVLTVNMSTLGLPLSGVYMLKVTTKAGAYHQKIVYRAVN